MATKPSVVPTWATDANYPAGSDSWSGTPTKVAPSSGVRQVGHIPATAPAAQHENFGKGLYGDWLTYLNDLHGSAEFLDKTYVWTGIHQFQGATSVTGDFTVGTSSADANPILLRGASIDFQSTTEIGFSTPELGVSGDISAGGGVSIAGEYLYGSAKSYTINVPLTAIAAEDPADWKLSGSVPPRWECATPASSKILYAHIPLPHTAVVTGVAMAVTQAADHANDMELRVYDLTLDLTGPTYDSSSPSIGSASADGSLGQDVVSVTGLSLQITTTHQLFVRILASGSGTGTDILHWLRVTFETSTPSWVR